jgi:ribosomal protein S19
MPDLVGKKVYIHNGKSYKLLEITSQIIGYKFGEFAFTKLPARYKKAAVNVKTKKR